jgi:hypothetical protein
MRSPLRIVPGRIEFGHIERQRQSRGERTGSNAVGQGDGEATFADGHPHS